MFAFNPVAFSSRVSTPTAKHVSEEEEEEEEEEEGEEEKQEECKKNKLKKVRKKVDGEADENTSWMWEASESKFTHLKA